MGSAVISSVLAVWIWAAVAAQAPAITRNHPADFTDAWFEGTIGYAPIRAYVGDAGWPKSDGVWGIYYYTKYWTPIALEGDWTRDGRLRLAEGDPGSDGPRPHFDLTVTRSSANGTWRSEDGRRTVPVRLRRVPKPAGFKDAIRSARRFADPGWPITFDYPEGWRLDVTGTHLKLRSPDPEDMLFENELSCTLGAGVPDPPGPDEPPFEFRSPFFRASSGWLVNHAMSLECHSGSDTVTEACEPIEAEEVRGATILRSNTGYRHYGPWGYMGAAETQSHLIIADGRWASCSDRLFDDESRLRAR